ncbi:MAG TPA: hypothetical protein VGV17_02915 [Bosea sp. (in: a-proteobacteria)]|jgi:hypothetical protein|uniref:hypothetical protein n=1 Tax=Bosea sp. (in: a-proteobacteria) TaxID=1871050 RepID=UPI002DDD7469|nr:hypothetical protein [Bosea sp. (in: a-proteobacteria)]HEV2552696.1 hypothetical protein [Bosea sp. (in: a-proteobacteria)]
MTAAPSLWLTVGGSIVMLAAFIIALRRATRPDHNVTNDWREIDERIGRRG